MQNSVFYNSHLERVSRSFSFCIARLEGEFGQQVALSYLLLRVLDTVEDIEWSTVEQQSTAFGVFEQLIDGAAKAQFATEVWGKWLQSIPPSATESERLLLADSNLLFGDLGETEPRARQIIINCIANMSRGMRYFQGQKQLKTQFKIGSLSELNGYCFFVAGVVGELLTELLLLRSREFSSNSKVFACAIQFGLFLQKINILKDQLVDEKEGRLLVQSRTELFASLKKDLAGAFEYLRSIPKSEVGFRLFCGWSLFLGLESLPWIQKSWSLKILDKIPRVLTSAILKDIENIILDDEALQARYQRLRESVVWGGAGFSGHNEQSPAEWITSERFLKLYHGRLEVGQLVGLGILPAVKA